VVVALVEARLRHKVRLALCAHRPAAVPLVLRPVQCVCVDVESSLSVTASVVRILPAGRLVDEGGRAGHVLGVGVAQMAHLAVFVLRPVEHEALQVIHLLRHQIDPLVHVRQSGVASRRVGVEARARLRVGHRGQHFVVGVFGALFERPGVSVLLVGLVLEGSVPELLTHLFAAGVNVRELPALGGEVAGGQIEEALARVLRAKEIVFAVLVECVALGRFNGHAQHLPPVVSPLVVYTRIVHAELPGVVVALIQARLRHKVRLAGRA